MCIRIERKDSGFGFVKNHAVGRGRLGTQHSNLVLGEPVGKPRSTQSVIASHPSRPSKLPRNG